MTAGRDTLLRRIEELETECSATLGRLVAHPYGSLERASERRALDAALRTQASLRRELADRFGDEVVVPLLLGVEPSPSVSGATLLQSEYDSVLLFNIASPAPPEDHDVALIRFSALLLTRFGLPNDEALEGHPLHGSGLSAYQCAEVLNSRWMAEADAQNRRAFPDYRLSGRHFVFTFHDSTLEVLARSLELEPLRTREAAMRRAVEILSGLGSEGSRTPS